MCENLTELDEYIKSIDKQYFNAVKLSLQNLPESKTLLIFRSNMMMDYDDVVNIFHNID